MAPLSGGNLISTHLPQNNVSGVFHAVALLPRRLCFLSLGSDDIITVKPVKLHEQATDSHRDTMY